MDIILGTPTLRFYFETKKNILLASFFHNMKNKDQCTETQDVFVQHLSGVGLFSYKN